MPTMTMDGVPVAFTLSGSGPPVVLLHCSASSGAQWRELADGLGAGFTTLAPDFFGCGATGAWPGGGPVRLADYARMIAALARSRGAPAHVVGHSFGGAVALRLALDAPELVQSLTLIEPVAFHLLREGEARDRPLYAEIRAVASAVFERTLDGHSHAGMARFVDYWNGAGAWSRLKPEVQDRLAAQIAGVAANFTALFADATPIQRYRRIATATLVLRGSDSPGPARRVAELVARALPLARLETVAGAGHMLPLTHGPAVLAAVRQHIASARAMEGATAA